MRLLFALALTSLVALSTAQITSNGLFFDGDRVISESATSLALPKQISGGAGLMVLREDGSVFAVADQSRGWLVGFHIPKGLPPLTQLSAGAQVSIGLKSDGTVVTWGDASYGIAPPVGLDHVVQVVSTGTSLAALKDDGKAVAWGNGQVVSPDLPLLKQIESIGKDHVGLTRTGKVIYIRDGTQPYRHDYNPPEVDPTPPDLRSDFVQIAGGAGQLVAVRADGSGVIFGRDPWRDYTGFVPNETIGKLANVRSIAFDGDPMAVLANGTVFKAELSSKREFPWSPVSTWYGSDVVQIVTSDRRYEDMNLYASYSIDTWILRRDGTITGAGGAIRGMERLVQIEGYQEANFAAWNAFGLRDDGTITYVPSGEALSGPSQIIAISVGEQFAALRADGTVVTWPGSTPPPAGLPPVAQVSVNYGPILTLLRDGSVRDLGSPSVVPADLPPVQSIATGVEGLALALLKTGQVRAWDRNGTAWFVPPGLEHVVKIQATNDLFLALLADGHVIGWFRELVDVGIPERVADIYSHGLTVMTKDFNGLWSSRRGPKIPLAPFPAVSVSGLNDPEFLGHHNEFRNRLYVVGLPELSVRFLAGTVSPNSSVELEVFSPTTSTKGIQVALTCFDPRVILPAHVTIPAGSHRVVVPVKFTAFSEPTPVAVSATLGTTTQFTQILVAHPFRLSVSKPFVIGGTDDRVTVTIRQRRPAGVNGSHYLVKYPDGFLVGPKAVMVPASQDSVEFILSGQSVQTFQPCRVQVGPTGKAETVEIVDYPLEPTNFACEGTIIGGKKLHVLLSLNAPVSTDTTFAFESTDPRVIPSGFILVPAHSASSTLEVPVFSRTEQQDISISLLGSPYSVVDVRVYGIRLYFESVYAGGRVRGFASVFWPHEDLPIRISAGEGISLPPNVTLLASHSGASLDGTTVPNSTGIFTVTAEAPGMFATISQPYKVAQVSGITVSPDTFRGGSSRVVTATVSVAPNPYFESVITLTSSRPELVSVPATVKIAAGAWKRSLPLKHHAVTGALDVKVTITATLNGSTVQSVVTVRPK